MLLSCQNIGFAYGVDTILLGVSFHINKGEQTAIVGVNGAGKTTLFKILTKQLTQDTGNIYISQDTTIGYLAQTNDTQSDMNVFDELYRSNEKLLELKKKIDDFEALLLSNPHPSEETLIEYHHSIEAFEAMGGYGYEGLVTGILRGLGFDDASFSQPVNSLSGGQKTRLALGRLLILEPNLLFLDEPTNHLDLDAIRWLEGYLSSYKGTLLIISHDRYFLDRIVTKVIDIERGKANVYNGNYSSFIQKKEFTQQISVKHFEQQQAEIKRQEEIIKKLRSFNQEKFIKRAESREKAIDKMEKLEKPFQLRANMNLSLNPKKESGQDVLHVQDLSMSFEDKHLFENLNLDIFKGDKIALIGSNGSGKTTLFKLLMQQLKPVHGKIKLGTSVEIAYYDQEHSNLNESYTLIEEIAEEFPDMEISKIRNLLAAFLFTGDDVFKEISALSGGEKGRISLAKLMLSKGNFLLLDEPTNHLDMISKEVLENALTSYSGTIFFISHDRYFINRVATKVVELTPNGVQLYHGNYDYYIEKKAERNQDVSQTVASTSQNKADWMEMKNQQRDQRKLENAIKSCEDKIEKMEQRIAEIDAALITEEVFSDYEKSNRFFQEKQQLEEELHLVMEEWEELLKDVN